MEDGALSGSSPQLNWGLLPLLPVVQLLRGESRRRGYGVALAKQVHHLWPGGERAIRDKESRDERKVYA